MKILGGMYNSKMWKKVKIKFIFTGRLCGSVPADESLIETWLKTRKPSVRPPSSKSIGEVAEEVINRLADEKVEDEEMEKRSTVTFEKVEGKLAIRCASLRAHLKDCASQVQNQFTGRVKGERNFTTKIKNGLYITGGMRDSFGTEMTPILRDNKPIEEMEIDGFQERTVHARTPQGEISALKRFAYIIQPTIQFTVGVLGKSVGIKDLETLLMYGAVHGFGGERSTQEGQYSYEIETEDKEPANV